MCHINKKNSPIMGIDTRVRNYSAGNNSTGQIRGQAISAGKQTISI